ncbi:MAG: hypothetical protein P8X73_02885 [Ignavibacteriaceae bacterium]
MATKFKLLIVIAFILTSVSISNTNNKIDDLAQYYSELLSYNLNHIIELVESLDKLSNESSIDKENLESRLNSLTTEINFANGNISNMIKYIPEKNLERIQKYLDNIDTHLAQVYVDIKTLRKKLNTNEQVNIPRLASDITNHIKQAENEDHLEIKKIQNYTSDHLRESSKNER